MTYAPAAVEAQASVSDRRQSGEPTLVGSGLADVLRQLAGAWQEGEPLNAARVRALSARYDSRDCEEALAA